ncbi:MAG: hypothetical protein ABFD16_18140 [Thermoguttaceae bacterium]|jgi:hypothetical protein
MFRNRIRQHFVTDQQRKAAIQASALLNFVVLPAVPYPWLMQQAMLMQQSVYQLAFLQAQATVERSWGDDDWMFEI